MIRADAQKPRIHHRPTGSGRANWRAKGFVVGWRWPGSGLPFLPEGPDRMAYLLRRRLGAPKR
jgi:hypothetical protein